MGEFFDRQFSVIKKSIYEYEAGQITLNKFIQNIEGLALAINNNFWSETISPLIDPLEEVNALALDEQRNFDLEDKKIIDEGIEKLKIVVRDYHLRSLDNQQ